MDPSTHFTHVQLPQEEAPAARHRPEHAQAYGCLGATTSFFTALIAYIVTGCREAFATYAALVRIVAGFVIATEGVLQGILLSSEEEKLNSMDLLRFMAPVAGILLVPTTLVMEPDALGPAIVLTREDPSFVWILLGNSSLAYLVNLTNFVWIPLGNSRACCRGSVQTIQTTFSSSQFVVVEFDISNNPWDATGSSDHLGIDLSSVTSVAEDDENFF